MDTYVKCAATILIGLILILLLGRTEKEFSLMLSLGVCTSIFLFAAVFLMPILDFMVQLEQITNLNSDIVMILFKCTGIGLLSQILSDTCNQAGEPSLGKALIFVSNCTVLYLSLPLLRQLLLLLEEVLVEI